MSYLVPFLAALFISVILTGVVRKLALSFGFVSKPRRRDVHSIPMPRIGGVAIFGSFLIVSLISFLILNPGLHFGLSRILGIDRHLIGIWIGSVILVGIMLIDDIRGLKPTQKLAAQVIVSLVMIASGVGIDHLTNPLGGSWNLNTIYIPVITYHGIVYHFSLLSDLLTLVWLVGMMNILNFVDGVDGLAGGLSAIAGFTIFLLSISVAVSQPATAMLSIILTGAALGFLVWNFPPAKIFMGDSGSMFLGLMLGMLPLISGGKLATVFLVLGFPIVDGVFVAVGRIIKKQNPMNTPDKTHLHHRFLEVGFSPRQAVLSMYLIATAFGWVALRSSTANKSLAALILVILLVISILILRLIRAKRARAD